MEAKNEDLKALLTDVVSEEFSHIPTDEDSIDFEFSPEFEKKMARAIRKHQRFYYPLFSTAARRVAVVCLCCLLVFSTAMSVEAVRAPILELANSVISRKTLRFDEDPTLSIDVEYGITWLPEGFELVGIQESTSFSACTLRHTYSDGKTTLVLNQTVYKSSNSIAVQPNTLTDISGKEVSLTVNSESCQGIWVDGDKYVFELTAEGPMEQEIFVQIIGSIQLLAE